MKALLLTTAMAAGLGLPALAQNATSPFQAEPVGPSVLASDVIGARIYASQTAVDADAYSGVQQGWNDIGEVNDIVLGRDGSVDAVLVDIGGFLGMGERRVAVDMSALRFVQDDATDADDWFLVLQADRNMLDTAPEWRTPGSAGETGMTGTGTTGSGGTGSDTMAGGATGGDTTGTDATGTGGTATGGGDTGTTGMVTGTPGAGTSGDNETGNPNAATNPGAREGYTPIERTALTTEMLSGANVYDNTDSSIAEISDLVLSPEGQVTQVVLDVGGFLGLGEKTVALPLDWLTVAQDETGIVRVWVDMTKEELEALPEYKAE